jgi:acetyltransferase-like isoleucine patch superfamily enzyme
LNPVSWLKSYIRSIILRTKFPTCVIYDGASVDESSTLGEYSVLFRDAALINSSLGAYSYVQSDSVVCNTEIGKFCSIASNVSIGLANHPMHMVSTSPVFYDNAQPLPKFMTDKVLFAEELPNTIIGSDVWIGYGVMIRAGVSIGVGAVIGAGSLVTKDIPPYSIAVGTPCKVIKYRFSEEIIDRLILSEWWMRSDAELKELTDFFIDPLTFLNKVGR